MPPLSLLGRVKELDGATRGPDGGKGCAGWFDVGVIRCNDDCDDCDDDDDDDDDEEEEEEEE
jgi:hypothetical protein